MRLEKAQSLASHALSNSLKGCDDDSEYKGTNKNCCRKGENEGGGNDYTKRSERDKDEDHDKMEETKSCRD